MTGPRNTRDLIVKTVAVKLIILVLTINFNIFSQVQNQPNQPKVALVFGITGQDGSYLAEFLLAKNYIVHGVKRRSSSFNDERIKHLYQEPHVQARKFILHYGDLTDSCSINALINKIQPDEIYNLGAQSHVKVSFEVPEFSANVDGLGTLRILDAIRTKHFSKPVRFYQASTSEMFGKVQAIPQSETTPFYPRSPYGASKVFSYWCTVNYREAYGLFACNGILFNHESPRRGKTFVTRKITTAIARIYHGSPEIIYLGNLNAKRDWGYAPDYVEAMWLMLQQDQPEDFVIATGETHTVREFLELAFKEINIELVWTGSGIDEIGSDRLTGRILVKIDPAYFRPTEVDLLLGDPTKAQQKLGWTAKCKFVELTKIMIQADLSITARKNRSHNISP